MKNILNELRRVCMIAKHDKPALQQIFLEADSEIKQGVIADIDVVELTPEILEKAGFVKDGSVYLVHKSQIESTIQLRLALIDKLWHCSLGDDKIGIAINAFRYLHQLQNIFYYLAGEELQINL